MLSRHNCLCQGPPSAEVTSHHQRPVTTAGTCPCSEAYLSHWLRGNQVSKRRALTSGRDERHAQAPGWNGVQRTAARFHRYVLSPQTQFRSVGAQSPEAPRGDRWPLRVRTPGTGLESEPVSPRAPSLTSFTPASPSTGQTDSGAHAQSGTLPRGPRAPSPNTQKEACVKLGNSRTKNPVSYVKRQVAQSDV